MCSPESFSSPSMRTPCSAEPISAAACGISSRPARASSASAISSPRRSVPCGRLLFTCFPPAFARLGTLLHIPLSLVLIGIVLRGSAFTFWRYGGTEDKELHHWGVTFAIASLITPLLLGTTVGAIASGALGEGGSGKGEGFYSIYVGPWLNPFTLSVGMFALVAFAFLAAVYLTLEAEDRELRADFRARALGTGVALFGAAVLALLLSARYAPRVRNALIFAG